MRNVAIAFVKRVCLTCHLKVIVTEDSLRSNAPYIVWSQALFGS